MSLVDIRITLKLFIFKVDMFKNFQKVMFPEKYF